MTGFANRDQVNRDPECQYKMPRGIGRGYAAAWGIPWQIGLYDDRALCATLLALDISDMRHRFSCLLLLAASNLAVAQQYVINTVAGGATPPTPVAASGSSFPSPGGLTIDSAGNLYAVSQNCVFTVSPSRVMNRIAGISRAGFSGDGGPALNAQFNVPLGLSLDTAKNLYVADSVNNRIRKVSALDGSISTVAGNGTAGFAGDGASATSAELNNPTAVVVDAAGNVYVADTGNNRVRKVSASGTITTVAGNGTAAYSGDGGPATSASLNGPMGLAIDSYGYLYIADTGNFAIRKIVQYGQIATVAGNGVKGGAYIKPGSVATTVGLGNVQSLAFDTSDNLFISDPSNQQIWKFSVNVIGPAWNVTVGLRFIGGVFDSTGIAVDGAGNVYLNRADYTPLLYQVSPDGTFTEIAGGENFGGDGGPAAAAQLSSPSGVALDSHGNLFIADTGNSVVREVTTDGIIHTVPALLLWNPSSLAFDSAGDLFVANGDFFFADLLPSQDPHTLLEVTPKGIVSPMTPQLNYLIDGMAFDSSGNLFVSTYVDVWKYAGGKWMTVAGNGAYPLPNTVAATTWISVDGAGALSTPLYEPAQIAMDAAGTLYIADRSDQRVRKVSGGLITCVAGSVTKQGVGAQGFAGDNGPAASAQLNNPMGVAIDSAGNIFIADTGNNRIRKVSVSGTITTIAGTGTPAYSGDGGLATAAELNAPSSLFLDKSGNIYIADTGNNAIRVLSSIGTLALVSASLPGATTGVAYFLQLEATGGALPYSWSVSAGSLPPGLTLSGSGSITGNATTPGTYTFTVTVSDAAKDTANQPFRIIVIAALAIPAATLPPAIVGASYSQLLAASGGTPPYAWSVTTGALPTGLSLSTAGLISGMPAAVGISSFTVQVTDSNSLTATQSFSIPAINPAPVVSTSATLPTAVTGVSYSAALSATGGNPPYAWSGTPPAGLQLSAAGVITSVPNSAGAFSFALTVTDSAALTVTQTFQLTVLDSATLARTAVLPQAQTGNGTALAITLTNSSNSPDGVELVQHWDDGTVSAGNVPAALLAPNAGFAVQVSDPLVTWVEVLSSGPLTVSAAVPVVTQFAPEFDVTYDNTAGPASSSMALVNLSASSITITATILDAAGAPLDIEQILLPANGHIYFSLVTELTATANARGTVKFQNLAGGNIAGCTLPGPPVQDSLSPHHRAAVEIK